MNIQEYIKRIHYKGDLTPCLAVLQELQVVHLFHVPFENLDIHYNTPIVLDLDQIYRKVVTNSRGGFCYELNGLFHSLLSAIGFDTTIISARVYNNKKENFGPDYDHLAIIVILNQKEYLVDVGFGDFTFHPLALSLDVSQSDPRGKFIIETIENGSYLVSKMDGKAKSIAYKFTRQSKDLTLFSEMCKFHQTSPNSHFTQKKLISRPTPNGRITITGYTLKISEGGITIKEHQFAQEKFGRYVKDWFDIDEMSLK